MDDVDLKLSDSDRAEAWRLLRSVAESGTTVLAVSGQAPGDTETVALETRKETADALAETRRA